MSEIEVTGAAADRLSQDMMGWLTTISASGQPQSSPVWFLLQDNVLWMRSTPSAAKVRHISNQPRVSFHLNDNGEGGRVVTIDATARLVDRMDPDVESAYVAKYGAWITGQLGSTPESMLTNYSAVIAIEPTRVRAW